MLKIFLTLSLIMSTSIAPLNLNWEKEYITFDPPQGFRYYMGGIEWGQLVYISTQDILQTESELQINFFRKRIISATLILGSAGIDDHNCLLKYKEVVKWLNKKYGHFTYRELKRDPVIDELIYASACYPVTVGLYSLKNVWKSKNFIIESSLVGEDGGIYIEIEYTIRKRQKARNQADALNIMKKL